MQPGTPAFDAFEKRAAHRLRRTCPQMAVDGEGATRLITVNVAGGGESGGCGQGGALANSPLVKTAVYGHDANWGPYRRSAWQVRRDVLPKAMRPSTSWGFRYAEKA